MKRKKLGIFLYNRLFDPLIQSNFWLYINHYLTSPAGSDMVIYLVTYEDKRFPLTPDQVKLVSDWQSRGLVWRQLRWNRGTGIFPKTIDILQGFLAVGWLRLRGCGHFVSLASVAGSYLYLYYVVLRFDFFLYQFEPHSEYAIDNNMWKEGSVQYRVAHYLERKAAESAKVIASGTHFMGIRLKDEWKVRAEFFRIPTVANDKKFLFSQSNRDKTRAKLGFAANAKVLLYPGKFGDLYYREETAYMFKWIWEEDHTFHFLIVTPHRDEEVVDLFNKAKADPSTYTIVHSDYDHIHEYYWASDFAVIAVPSGPSKKFISNIKVGEYLCAGLPFLIIEGISEDYLYAINERVGVVVKDFKYEYIKSSIPEIEKYLAQDRESLRHHCREVGLAYRGFDNLNVIFRKAVHSLYNN